MTRTERASYPRAINRDRSLSRKGLDPAIRKHGAGSHNWGDPAHEWMWEELAMQDEQREFAEEEERRAELTLVAVHEDTSLHGLQNEEDEEDARKNALKESESDSMPEAASSPAP